MRAMILAAGRGERLRPLTDHMPKPLLEVGGKPMLQYHLEKLAALGIVDVVINLGWLGEQIVDWAKDGSRFGLCIHYSREDEMLLDTGGGIRKALPLLGKAPFLLLNADVWSDYPLDNLLRRKLASGSDGCLVMVENPTGHNGDFLIDGGKFSACGGVRWTFSGVSMLSPALFDDKPIEVFPLRELFCRAICRDRLSAECYRGEWWDIGTPERLSALRARLEARSDTALECDV